MPTARWSRRTVRSLTALCLVVCGLGVVIGILYSLTAGGLTTGEQEPIYRLSAQIAVFGLTGAMALAAVLGGAALSPWAMIPGLAVGAGFVLVGWGFTDAGMCSPEGVLPIVIVGAALIVLGALGFAVVRRVLVARELQRALAAGWRPPAKG